MHKGQLTGQQAAYPALRVWPCRPALPLPGHSGRSRLTTCSRPKLSPLISSWCRARACRKACRWLPPNSSALTRPCSASSGWEAAAMRQSKARARACWLVLAAAASSLGNRTGLGGAALGAVRYGCRKCSAGTCRQQGYRCHCLCRQPVYLIVATVAPVSGMSETTCNMNKVNFSFMGKDPMCATAAGMLSHMTAAAAAAAVGRCCYCYCYHT